MVWFPLRYWKLPLHIEAQVTYKLQGEILHSAKLDRFILRNCFFAHFIFKSTATKFWEIPDCRCWEGYIFPWGLISIGKVFRKMHLQTPLITPLWIKHSSLYSSQFPPPSPSLPFPPICTQDASTAFCPIGRAILISWYLKKRLLRWWTMGTLRTWYAWILLRHLTRSIMGSH